MKFVMLEENIKKTRGAPGDHETLFIIRHVGLHVNFSSMKSSLDL